MVETVPYVVGKRARWTTSDNTTFDDWLGGWAGSETDAADGERQSTFDAGVGEGELWGVDDNHDGGDEYHMWRGNGHGGRQPFFFPIFCPGLW
ncbi:hypothetical protein N7492_006778 [Penicillium capsulatum]|uniref:Uncharacterized protein n=1 Tax=Penicillium capsulatum TaxID=69766 RepID=A0A9W9LLG8_9EURO|nr:hypothetical protein N7492_006778 [Penicillium capsulatum]KAJ6116614.1 hypothetical protein N7512_006339 [Penicillium capsulatum]